MMFSQKQKKQLAILILIATIVIVGWKLYELTLYYIRYGKITWLWTFNNNHGWKIGVYILSIGTAIMSTNTKEKAKNILLTLSGVTLIVWMSPSFLQHVQLMSWQGLYDYEWVQRLHFVPFNGKLSTLFIRLIIPVSCNFDSWNNILLFLTIGILAAGTDKKRLWLGIVCIGSLLIEILQLITRIGCCDIDDVIYRLIGLFLGFGIGYLVIRKSRKTA